jgi:hypothetical protein
MNRRNFLQTSAGAMAALSPLLLLAQDDIHFVTRVGDFRGDPYEVYGWRWNSPAGHDRNGYDFVRPVGTWEAASDAARERSRSIAVRYMRGNSSES